MGWWKSRVQRSLSPERAAQVGLAPNDRLLSVTDLAHGGFAAASMARLVVVDAAGNAARRFWSEVDQAEWNGESSTLMLTWYNSKHALPLEISDPRTFPDVVRERVQASVLISGSVRLDHGAVVRLALRRSDDGAVREQVIPGPGVDLESRDVVIAVDRGLRNLRSEVALDTQEIIVIADPVT